MNRIWKMGAVILLAFFAFGKIQAQPGTKILAIDSIYQGEPIVMFDTTTFYVQVSVNDTSALNADSITGDLFYYLLTDSMINAGTPPRIINTNPSVVDIVGVMSDSILVDIRPSEMRTTPVNLIILWPAMTNPEVSDSDSVAIVVGFDGYLSIPEPYKADQKNLIFPCPALQYLYIRQEELGLIEQIKILSMDGKLMTLYHSTDFSSGFINLNDLATGNYLVEIQYHSSRIARTKLIKH